MRISDWSSDVCSSDLFFDDHDELYFNAIGIGWNFAIERGSVEVRLPQPVPVADLTAEAYTGGHGSGSQDFHASVPAPGTARWTLTRPLAPGEGMTVALSFPKGVVAEPTPAEKARWLLKDNSADRKSTRLNSSHYCASRM